LAFIALFLRLEALIPAKASPERNVALPPLCRAQGQVSRRKVRAAAGPDVTVETNGAVAAKFAACASMVSNRDICCSELLREPLGRSLWTG
jgi:hypothetical protein